MGTNVNIVQTSKNLENKRQHSQYIFYWTKVSLIHILEAVILADN